MKTAVYIDKIGKMCIKKRLNRPPLSGRVDSDRILDKATERLNVL
ncbi:MAG TPA: hypothetical protein V6D48_20955 [Oculatellaceae cyanobacterium]